ncbi:hypothetical protein [Variovorax sp. UMC13]|uniref:hypothetical protein n=1 Tax=Variovorax sp. UMC13 TaxID=1862326 RepID=UPI00160343B0|nr:hypothetical protein [Variovorax sp. UMC13]MBB1601067.1 hypothetical protein [Variovorax sp. UMC13]
MAKNNLDEAAVQSVIALAQELKPWGAEFTKQSAHVLAGYADQAHPAVDTLELLLTVYLRVLSARQGPQRAAAARAAILLASMSKGDVDE